jgi:hypothetical protein
MSGIIHSWPIEIDFNRAQIRSRIRETDVLDLKSETSYIVFTDGSKYYAKNGSTGMVEYSDTDASDVIQYAIGNIPLPGGTIFIRRGTYVLSKAIVINKFINLVGEGVRATVLKLADNANSSMIDYAIPSDIADNVSQLMYIAHMMLDGNKANQSSGTQAIRTIVPGYSSARDFMIYDVWIDNYKGDGIYLVSHNYLVLHVAIEHNNGWGIILNGAGGFIIGNWIWSNTEGGIYHLFSSSNANPNVIMANLIAGGKSGIRIEGATSGLYRIHIISNNYISGTDANTDTIYIKNTLYTLIFNNYINAIFNRYGIYEDTGTDETFVFGNYLSSSRTTPYYVIQGPNSKIWSLMRWKTVDTGVATIPAGQTRVTVSLTRFIKAPTKVLVTPIGQPLGKIWVENITSTTFDIVTDTAPISNLNVAWYAEV